MRRKQNRIEKTGRTQRTVTTGNGLCQQRNKEYGTVKAILPEAGTLERATTYRDKKIKPLFIQMKNKIAAMAVQVKELTKEVEKWKHKYQKTKQAYNQIQRELDKCVKKKSSYLMKNNNCRMFLIDMTG